MNLTLLSVVLAGMRRFCPPPWNTDSNAVGNRVYKNMVITFIYIYKISFISFCNFYYHPLLLCLSQSQSALKVHEAYIFNKQSGNYKDSFDTATTTANRSMGVDPPLLLLGLIFRCYCYRDMIKVNYKVIREYIIRRPGLRSCVIKIVKVGKVAPVSQTKPNNLIISLR